MNFPGQRGAGVGAFSSRNSHKTTVSTVFLVVLAATVTGGVASWLGSGSGFAVFVFVFGLYFTVLCLHEFAHAFTAHRGGDRSIAARGYLDLNPLRYMNPLFSLILPAIWLIIGGLPLPGGAVLVDRSAIRKRSTAAMVSAAGPLMNVAAAAISLALVAAFEPTMTFGNARWIDTTAPHWQFWAGLSAFGFLQVAAAILNLIPVPGLDGYGIIEPYLRYETRQALDPIRPYGILAVFLLMAAFPPVRDGFSTLVDNVLSLGQQPNNSVFEGLSLFRFWSQ